MQEGAKKKMRKLIDRWAGSSGSEGLFCDEGEHLWESLLQRLGGRAQVLQKFLACDLPPIDQVRDGLERKHGNLRPSENNNNSGTAKEKEGRSRQRKSNNSHRTGGKWRRRG